MKTQKNIVTSGVEQLDALLGGGIFIGDNVVWYDDAGTLASVFSLNLVKASLENKRYLIYVSFDRSPKNLLEVLGPLAENNYLTILDCFTDGKGESSDIFLNFYKRKNSGTPCKIVRVDEPHNADHVAGAFYSLHKTLDGDVRFVFESLTGMQELWGSEDHILKFYSHSCPRLYELNTVAYWVVEKEAHSQQLRAHLNKITQVAIDLSLKRGRSSLTVLKAEKRDISILNKQSCYWNRGLDVVFESERRATGRFDLGARLKELRVKRGLSQTELAKHVGVTPSTISQVESSQIYPSLPALIKMSEILSVDLSSFFVDTENGDKRVVFSSSEAVDVSFPDLPKGSIYPKSLIPFDGKSKAEPFFIEIPPKTKLPAHFFRHKGDEVGYLLSGGLKLTMEGGIHTAEAGDLIYLTSEMPLQWENAGEESATLIWMKIR